MKRIYTVRSFNVGYQVGYWDSFEWVLHSSYIEYNKACDIAQSLNASNNLPQ